MGYEDKTREELINELQALHVELDTMKQRTDVTARAKAEDTSIPAEQFRDMVEHSPIPMAFYDRKNNTMEYLNSKFIKTFGYTLEDIPTLEAWWLRAYPDQAYRQQVMDTWNKVVKTAIKEGGPIEAIPYNVTCRNGEVRIIEISGAPVGPKNLALFNDITGRRKAEEALEEIEAKFRLFMEHSPIYVFFKDENIRSLHLSKNYERMLGRPVHELLGKSMYELFPSELAKSMVEDDLRIMREGKPLEVEEEFNGRSYITLKFPIYVEGKPRFLAGFTMDITERKELEKELRQQIERHDLIVAGVRDGIWDWDVPNERVFFSPRWKAMRGFSEEEVSDREEEWSGSIHPEDAPRVFASLQAHFEGKTPWFYEEYRVRRKDGSWMWILDRGVALRDDAGQVIRMAGSETDITVRKNLEEEREKLIAELQDLNRDFVIFLENTTDFIYFKDKNSRFRFCSQAVANITGHTSWRDMIGKHDLEVFPKDVAKTYYEEELPVFLNGIPLLNKTDPYYDAQGRLGWVNTNKWPVFDSENKVIGIFGISRDITEHKRAEEALKILNQELQSKASELELAYKDMESFSYSISHDLRAPLRIIKGLSDIVLKDYHDKLDDEGKKLLRLVHENTQRMDQLVLALLDLSRAVRQDLKIDKIDMEKAATLIAGDLKAMVPERNIEVSIKTLPPAHGDLKLIRQVLANLLSNAVKFTKDRDVASIEVGSRREGDENIYYVKDNGAGFDMEQANRLFKVFQRLHSLNEFEGIGIGLSIVYRIIQRHGGCVWAEGKPGEGATFYFSLPRKEE